MSELQQIEANKLTKLDLQTLVTKYDAEAQRLTSQIAQRKPKLAQFPLADAVTHA